jgi:hypothetical protein
MSTNEEYAKIFCDLIFNEISIKDILDFSNENNTGTVYTKVKSLGTHFLKYAFYLSRKEIGDIIVSIHFFDGYEDCYFKQSDSSIGLCVMNITQFIINLKDGEPVIDNIVVGNNARPSVSINSETEDEPAHIFVGANQNNFDDEYNTEITIAKLKLFLSHVSFSKDDLEIATESV